MDTKERQTYETKARELSALHRAHDQAAEAARERMSTAAQLLGLAETIRAAIAEVEKRGVR